MITLPLQMRYSDKPQRPARAWLIPGAEPYAWLDEMLAWGVPLDDAALYLIPRSAQRSISARVAGCLAASTSTYDDAPQPALCGACSTAFRRKTERLSA